jgi:hypothetical protein
VKSDETGDDGMSFQVEDFCCRRDRGPPAGTDTFYPPIAQDDGLIFTPRRPCAIDQGDTGKGNEWGVDGEKTANPWCERGSLRTPGR